MIYKKTLLALAAALAITAQAASAAAPAPEATAASETTEAIEPTEQPGKTVHKLHPNGYCGSVSFDVLTSGAYDAAEFGFTTTHGVIIRDRIFLGGGVGYIRNFNHNQYLIPIYGEARVHFKHKDGRLLPHIGLRLGGAIASEGKSGFYGTAAVGIRVPLGGKMGLSIELGPSLTTKYTRGDSHKVLHYKQKYEANGLKAGVFMRLGFDF